MTTLAQMIDDRRGNTSYDDLAREINMKTATLHRYVTGERNMSVPNIRKIAAWAREKGDTELVSALASYALGFNVLSSDAN